MFVKNPGGISCTPPSPPDAVECARMRRSLCEQLQHCSSREVNPKDIESLVEKSGKTLVELHGLDQQELLGLFMGMSN